MKSCTHTFLTACRVCLSLSPATSQLVSSLSFTALFSGRGIFWGVLLHDVYIVMERWEGGNFGQMTMIHVCKQKQIQYCSLSMCQTYYGCRCRLLIRAWISRWLIIFGCDKNKDSFIIYYYILTFGKSLLKYEGKACRFLQIIVTATNFRLMKFSVIYIKKKKF